MSIFRQTFAFTSGSVVVNAMAGSKFEFLGRPAAVSVWASQTIALSEIQIDLTLGNVVVAEDINPNFRASNVIAKDQDGIGSGVGDAGDRIQLRMRNTGVGVPSATVLVEINELA